MKRVSKKLQSIAVLFFIFLFGASFGVLRNADRRMRLQDSLLSMSRPWYRAVRYLENSGGGLKNFFLTRKETALHIGELERETVSLREEVSRFGELRAENAALRRALGDAHAPKEPPRTVARIIGKAYPFEREILLDADGNTGIADGDAVVAGRQTLVGVVYETLPTHAKVRLVEHHDFRAAALSAEGRIEGLVRGGRGGEVLFGLVPQGAALREGETVVTSGFDGLFEPGLVIGKIFKIISKPTDLFLEAEVLPDADVGGLETVTLIRAPERDAQKR